MSAIVTDVETTGLSSHEDRICEIAMVTLEGAILLDTRINPECIITEELTAIHGITDEMVKDSPTFGDLASMIGALINEADAIMGYNPFFDQRFLAASCVRAGIEDIRWPPIICAKRLWDIHEPPDKRQLINAYKRFINEDGFHGAHGALADTEATRKVLVQQFQEFELTSIDWDKLDPEVTLWWGPTNHVVWKDGFIVFNVGKHKGVRCNEIPTGYWRWIQRAEFPEHVKVLADFLTDVRPDITAEDLAGWAYGRRL